MQKLKIVHTPATSCQYRSIPFTTLHIICQIIRCFANKWRESVWCPDTIKSSCQASNNMYSIQLWALATATALYQVWQQGHKWLFPFDCNFRYVKTKGFTDTPQHWCRKGAKLVGVICDWMWMLNADFKQNLVTKYTLKVSSWSLILTIRLIYLNTSLSSKAREVTANLLAGEKILKAK